VYRYADSPSLIGDGAADCLTDPPCRVRAELVSATILELVGGADQADVAFLNQIEEGYAASNVFLGDADDQTGIRADKMLLRQFAVSDEITQVIHIIERHRFAALLNGAPCFYRALHPLCQRDFFLCRKKRDTSCFFEIQAHNIIAVERLLIPGVLNQGIVKAPSCLDAFFFEQFYLEGCFFHSAIHITRLEASAGLIVRCTHFNPCFHEIFHEVVNQT
jgi:hypothetical protein